MKIKPRSILTLLVLFCLCMQKPALAKLPQDIIERSKNYIEMLNQKPLESLSMEDKLTLLHSYYNVEDYKNVIRIADSMPKELEGLSLDRQKPFYEMINEARRKLG